MNHGGVSGPALTGTTKATGESAGCQSSTACTHPHLPEKRSKAK